MLDFTMKKSVNLELSKIFYDMSRIYALKKVDWKPQAYFRVAKEMTDLRQDIVFIWKKGGLKALEELPAIGKGISKKIVEYIKTGKIREYEKLKQSLPEKLVEVSKVPGLGAKRAKILYDKLKIKSVQNLKQAIKKGLISKLKGFGLKSEKNISEVLKVYKSQSRRRPYSEMNKIALKIKKRLEKLQGTLKIDICGSLRRKAPTIRDIDLLAISNKPNYLIEYFCKMKEVKKIIAKGPTKVSVLLLNNIEIDLRVVSKESYGASLLYFTGGKDLNIKMRKIAISKGYKLSEYGLFSRKTSKKVAGKNEKDIFNKLGMPYIKPKQR